MKFRSKLKVFPFGVLYPHWMHRKTNLYKVEHLWYFVLHNMLDTLMHPPDQTQLFFETNRMRLIDLPSGLLAVSNFYWKQMEVSGFVAWCHCHVRLTLPISRSLVSMTTMVELCSQSILQKSSVVSARGPCVAMYAFCCLYTTEHKE